MAIGMSLGREAQGRAGANARGARLSFWSKYRGLGTAVLLGFLGGALVPVAVRASFARFQSVPRIDEGRAADPGESAASRTLEIESETLPAVAPQAAAAFK